MIGWLLRILLVAAGAIAALFISRDAENFGVVQGLVAVALIGAIVVVLALSRRK